MKRNPSPRSTVLLLAGLGLLALALRLWAAGRCALPSQDGTIYLYMARALAEGDWREALGRVFHPLPALLLAPAAGPGLEVWAHRLLALAGAGGALTIYPLARLLGAGRWPALAAVLVAACDVYAVRYVGDIYAEPLFLLLAGGALGLAFRREGGIGRARALAAGLVAGLAFTARPEGAALILGLVVCGRRRLLLAVAAVVPVSAYLGARWAATGAFTPTPKLGFMAPMGPLAAADPLTGIGTWLLQLGRVFLVGVEAFGPLVVLLALVGLVFKGGAPTPDGTRSPRRALVLTLATAVAAMACFQVKRRFLVDWQPLVLALAALGATRVLDDWRRRWVTPALVAAAAVTVVIGLVRLHPPRKMDKLPERELGRWLLPQLPPGTTLATDIPRVAYYAGLPPPPPRPPTLQDLEHQCALPTCRFLVLGTRRPLLRRFGPPPSWRPLELPSGLAAKAAARGVQLFRHRAR